MPLRPRFLPGSARRPFVDREGPIAAFHQLLAEATAAPDREAAVLNITGIGGIGKSRLLTEMANRAGDGHLLATLDLQVPSQRLQENALAAIRVQFGRGGATFPRFDIAYAVWWQRLHPNLRISRDGLSLVEHSDVLTAVVDEASGVPVFGASVRLIDWATRRLRQWHWIRNDATLQELDLLTIAQLADATTYLFAEELSRQAAKAPFLLFVDAYEALVAAAGPGQSSARDAWLRDLIGQLRRGLVVIASREPVGWHEHDPEWTSRIVTCPVGDLPMESRLELLTSAGLPTDAASRVIAETSAGVPFYLHLAIDAGPATRGPATSGAVSPTMLLERFLQHVDPAHIGLLEVLSVPRTFDTGIFAAVARHYQLVGNALVWQAITGYSFVSDASVEGGATRLQLHQLMIEALRARLTPEVTTELHRLLRRVWDDRAAQASEVGGALREAAYHGLWAGDLSDHDVLSYADQILIIGDRASVDGLRADLEQYVDSRRPADGPGSRLPRLLHAEAALVRGEAGSAVAAVGEPPADYADEVDARLAVACAHGRRILGETDAALALYEDIIRGSTGQPRLAAGLWAADLHMCQGRTTQALTLAEGLLAACPADEHTLRGDIYRLICLTYRFAFDFAEAATHLAAARAEYTAANNTIGLANIATNEVEVLAHVDHQRALTLGPAAARTQEELGASHEAGKTYTAMAIAQLRATDLDGADRTLDLACEHLERAGYRSGRARAEMVRATVLVRRGEAARARECVRWAVTEFEAVAVYPMMILTGMYLLDWLDAQDPEVLAAARRARTGLDGRDNPLAIDERIVATLAAMLGAETVPTRVLHRVATSHPTGSSGFYNRNLAVRLPSGRVLVRVPLHAADAMDLRLWPETAVLRTVNAHQVAAPRLLLAADDPVIQVHEYVEGVLLDVLAPRGQAVPDRFIDDVTSLFATLADVPFADVPALPADWPGDGDCAGFAKRLVDITENVYRGFAPEFGALFAALGIPDDPLAAVRAELAELTSRPFRLVHADVHRKNVIMAERGAVFLDWELALWGDPVYDLASHLHKMGYLPHERVQAIDRWGQKCTGGLGAGWLADLDRYLRHEQVKSSIVDSVRYAKLVANADTPPSRVEALVTNLTAKLANGARVWGTGRTYDMQEVHALLRASGR